MKQRRYEFDIGDIASYVLQYDNKHELNYLAETIEIRMKKLTTQGQVLDAVEGGGSEIEDDPIEDDPIEDDVVEGYNFIVNEADVPMFLIDDSPVKFDNNFKMPKLGLTDLKNDMLKKMSCLHFMQYIILKNKGAITVQKFLNSLTVWTTADPVLVEKAKFVESNVRAWISTWKRDGYIIDVPGTRALYSMTKQMLDEAKRKSIYIKADFEGDPMGLLISDLGDYQ